jgi:transposase
MSSIAVMSKINNQMLDSNKNMLEEVGEANLYEDGEIVHLWTFRRTNQAVNDEENGQSDKNEKTRSVLPSNDSTIKPKKQTIIVKKKCSSVRTYRDYTDRQKQEFIKHLMYTMNVTKAANLSGINIKTAYKLRTKWNKFGCVDDKKRGPTPSNMLIQEHVDFITSFVNSRFGKMTLSDMRNSLQKEFPAVTISKTVFHKFIRDKCDLSAKKLKKIPQKANNRQAA